jgi:choline dehydrogenase
MDAFDHIIVGAGSAGCLLANRLGADGTRTVCVLEAGPPDSNPWLHVPAGYMKTLFDPSVTWQLKTAPCDTINGRQLEIPQGRTLGGSSAVNGMLYVRGQPIDYDTWAALGNPGWSYAELLPYFKRFERRIAFHGDAGDDRYRGRAGELPVATPDFPNSLCDAFVDSAAACGFPRNPDHNGARQEGAGRVQTVIHRGRRFSAATAFLHPAVKKGNVSVRPHALVSRIRFEGRRAAGVDYIDADGRTRSVDARQGVVLSAGPIQSPKILQLSGIGPAALLAQFGIPVLCDLPAVGTGLRDHYSVRFTYRARDDSDSINNFTRGFALALQVVKWKLGRPSILAIGPAVCHAYGRTDPALAEPDFSLLFGPASMKAGFFGRMDDYPGMTCGAWKQRPDSYGHVRIQSADAREAPLFDPRYLAHERDRAVLVKALKIQRRIFASEPMARHVVAETQPGPQVQSDDEWLDFARRMGSSSWHMMGSCRMGPASDASATVGPDLKVHGIDGLHVVDASVMPTMPSANTYASVMVVADKAADLILGRPPLAAAQV